MKLLGGGGGGGLELVCGRPTLALVSAKFTLVFIWCLKFDLLSTITLNLSLCLPFQAGYADF